MSKNPLFLVDEIIEAVSGKVLTNSEFPINNVSVDSRSCKQNTLFIPLKGERTDGHFFIESAFKNGAIFSFVTKKYFDNNKKEIENFINKDSMGFVVVEDTLRALQDLARYHIKRHSKVKTIGVTGSSGKTTTKEIIGAILKQDKKVSVNIGNFNSEIGLPLSVFNITENHEYAVFEMGMNHKGEMDILVDIVRPCIALITNVGRAHIGLLGSIDAIAEEKKKIFSRFDGRQVGFIHEDEVYFDFLKRDVKGEINKFGINNTPGFIKFETSGIDGYVITYKDIEIKLSLTGNYNLNNTLGAISIADYLNIEKSDIKNGIESIKPLFGRGEVIKNDVTIIQDCYNANPESVSESIAYVNELPWDGRKVFVIGSMLELGDVSDSSHRELGKKIAYTSANAVFFFGKETETAFDKFRIEKGLMKNGSTKSFWTSDFNELRKMILKYVKRGDLVLLKGSRSMALERLTAPILEEYNLIDKTGSEIIKKGDNY